MLKPPHPVAQLAYALAMTINPNNHALDGGRATSAMEKEAVAQIAAMFGWKTFLGHLCGGGTMANLEALWVAGQFAPRKTILASAQAHYTHERISKVLQLPFETVECDALGRMNVSALEKRVAQGRRGHSGGNARHDRDGIRRPAAEDCGAAQTARVSGFMLMPHMADILRWWITWTSQPAGRLRRRAKPTRSPLIRTSMACSPTAAAAYCSRTPQSGRWYKHSSPYTYFTSNDLHLGEISLECSRPGAAAAALWATQELLPLVKGGEFARSLAKSREAALALFAQLQDDERFMVPFRPELDLVIFAVRAGSVSEVSALSRRVFEAAAKRDLHLALAELPLSLWANAPANMVRDRDTMTCLRSVLMKPEHLQWVERIWERLGAAVVDANGAKFGNSRGLKIRPLGASNPLDVPLTAAIYPLAAGWYPIAESLEGRTLIRLN